MIVVVGGDECDAKLIDFGVESVNRAERRIEEKKGYG